MRKALIPALLLVLVSVVLGATVFREQVAQAAATLMVREQNLDANGNIKVHEQGTATVDAATGPAQQAMQKRLFPTVSELACFTVPSGRRVVIEEVSGLGELSTGQNSAWGMFATVGGLQAKYSFGADGRTPTTNPDREFIVFSEPTTIYADGGTQVCGDVIPVGSQPFDSEMDISGYTVAMP